MGKFSNGLRYYVRANKKPEKRMELRLVVKAGSDSSLAAPTTINRALAHRLSRHTPSTARERLPEE